MKTVPVIGKLGGDEAMSVYTFGVTLDGEELPVQTLARLNDDAAIQHGLGVLQSALRARPGEGYCSVFLGDEPLGCWATEGKRLVWEPEE